MASLLEALSEEPSHKTNLASRANLDTRATNRYLTLILQTNLVTIDADSEIRITPKGKDFLEEYKKLKMFLEA